MGRLFVFERAKYLLETATKISARRRKKKEEFWAIIGKAEGIKVKVIVRSIKNGPKHLFSIIRKGHFEKEIEGREFY